MTKVLNKGLNFSVLPKKIDNTQILAEYKRFERTMTWKEYWSDEDNNSIDTRKESIFKIEKHNFPRKYKTSNGLKTYLESVKSELMDPLNRSKVNSNLTLEEFNALVELDKLQKEKHIVIKPCDKGAGVIILDYHEYINACNNHLNMVQNIYGQENKYYEEVDKKDVTEAKEKIKSVLEEAYDNEVLNLEEFNAMNPDGKPNPKFYCTFKVHKKHVIGKAPPERPIESVSGSFSENLGKYVDHNIKYLGSLHPSFLKDTPHFLRLIEAINKTETLPSNAIIVTMDVSALYTNIPHNEGIQSTREALYENNNDLVNKEFILRLLDILLYYNVFGFNRKLYKQLIGAAMGSAPIPSYANIFMARKIDTEIMNIISNYQTNGDVLLKIFKRFLDDLFFIFIGESKVLHKIHEEINNIHPAIKLTMNHTSISEQNPCDCPKQMEIPFLDVSVSVKSGKICTDLYKKPTDRNQYLLTSSCHPLSCFKSIPFSLALRIIRICSEPAQRDLRMTELKKMLIDREYDENLIDNAIRRALRISRNKALEAKTRPESNTRPVFVSTFDPRLPDISKILSKHWRSMCWMDNNFKKTFPNPPIAAFKKQKNIRNFVIRAKVYSENISRNQRTILGMFSCNKPCLTCPFVNQRKKISCNNFTWEIRKKVNCETSNIVYLIECNKTNCNQKYIGESKRSLKERFTDHKGYVKSNIKSQPTGHHFNLPGHDISNMTVTILEQSKKRDDFYRKERERYLINKFDTYENGMNKKP